MASSALSINIDTITSENVQDIISALNFNQPDQITTTITSGGGGDAIISVTTTASGETFTSTTTTTESGAVITNTVSAESQVGTTQISFAANESVTLTISNSNFPVADSQVVITSVSNANSEASIQ